MNDNASDLKKVDSSYIKTIQFRFNCFSCGGSYEARQLVVATALAHPLDPPINLCRECAKEFAPYLKIEPTPHAL